MKKYWIFFLLCLPLLPAGCRGGAPPGNRVLLVGMEGVSWDLLEAMINTGEVPHFARLRSAGAWGVLESADPIKPASLWATIATGRTEAGHEVRRSIRYDETAHRLDIPSRTAAAVWEIAARRQIPSGVIGWPSSSPIPGELPVRIDDLAFYRGLGLEVPFEGKSLSAPALAEKDKPYVGRLPKGGDLSARIEAASLEQVPDLAAGVWPKLRLLAVFIDGLNSARHYAGADRMLGGRGLEPAFGKPSRKHMREVDATLGKLLALADENTMVLVATDDPTYLPGQTADGEFVHPVHGLVAVMGPLVVPGRRMDNPTVLDFVPMALTHLGLPLSEEMPGNPFREAWSAPPPQLPLVATHDVFIRRPYPPGGSLDDPGAIVRVKQMIDLAKPGHGPFNERNVYALELLAGGNVRGAYSEALIDSSAHSSNAAGQYVLGEVLVEQGRRTVALENFGQAAAALTDNPTTEPERSMRVIVGLAAASMRLSVQQPDQALLELHPVLRLCGNCVPAVALLARCHLARGEADRAVAIVESVLNRQPNDRDLLLVLGQAKLKQNDLRGAREAWIAAIGKERVGPLEAHLELGLLAIRERMWDEAAHHLRLVTRLQPDNAYAWFELATAYANQDDRDEAEEALRACLRADPTDARAWLAWRKIKQADGEEEDAQLMLAAARGSVAIDLPRSW